jgi:hypothetical protein
VSLTEQDRRETEALLLQLEEADDLDNATDHPAFLLDKVKCVDATTGETFQFQLLDEDAPWYWQRKLLDSWISDEKNIVLKARQLGITWLAAGLALWYVL